MTVPNKHDLMLELLEKSSVFIHLDPRHPKAVVPKQFHGQYKLVLQMGLNMVIQIYDLEVDDLGVSGTLSFNKRPEWVSLPWDSIYAIIGEQGGGYVWNEDIPPEVIDEQRKLTAKTKKKLAAVTAETPPVEAAAPEAKGWQPTAKSPSPKVRPPYLRLVK